MASGTTGFNFPELDKGIVYKYFNKQFITISTTTNIKTSAGFIHSISWFIPAAGATGGSIEVYDDPSTTNNQVFEVTQTSGTGPAASGCFMMDGRMLNGITVVTGGTNAPFVTVTYV